MLFFPGTSQASERVDATPIRRRSTTISMMEEEFGIRELPQTTRLGIPSKLRLLPPKRKRSSTQVPEPRRNSPFLEGSWEAVWDCDVDIANGNFVEPPLEEDVNVSGSVSDYQGQDNQLDHDFVTPTNGDPWSTNGEITPQFSSNFPNTPNPGPLGRKGHFDRCREFLGFNASHPADSEPDES
ncbi:hypothetical protein F5148DRAFT_1282223 [Russula earlei]|uniref:Uncharacterized protein n=1 Tax=Russula earlei TaxID=71964 RepID=A0ACC0UET0_9AGAM|nr:hypothetical protein F5148DRAFT_1282223 [Russula earlei]